MNVEKGLFPMATKSNPRATEAPPVRAVTTPDKAMPPVKTKERGPGKKARIALAGLAVVGGAGLGAYEAYENVPAVHRAVDSAFLDHIRGKSSLSEASNTEVFDPTATSGVIKPSMIERFPQEEIDKLYPTAFGKLGSENKELIIISSQEPDKKKYPDIQVEVSEEKNTLQLQYFLDLSQSVDPDAEISFTKTFSGFGQITREALSDKGYYDTLHFGNVPSGTKISHPLGGYMLHYPNMNDPEKSGGTLTDFIAPNGDIYRLSIMAFENSTTNLPDPRFATPALVLRDIANIPLFTQEANHKPVGTYGKKVERGPSPVLEINHPQGKPVEIVVQLNVVLKGKGEERARTRQTPYILTDLELLSTSEGKIIASKPN